MAAILDSLTGLALISCWYQHDARQDEFKLKLLHCEFQKYKVMTMSVVDVQLKKIMQIPAIKQQTCHIKCTFLISDYYKFIV